MRASFDWPEVICLVTGVQCCCSLVCKAYLWSPRFKLLDLVLLNAQDIWFLKVLANEDTLLRKHCCSWRFLARANWETFVADTKCFWSKSETFLCPGHKICIRNKCCARGQTGKHVCRQQCVRNNVSSFASTLTYTPLTRSDILRIHDNISIPVRPWVCMKETHSVHQLM